MPESPQKRFARRTWRGQPPAGASSGPGKWARRALLSLLAASLCGAFAWLLWSLIPGSQVHLAVLPIVDYGVLPVPPVRYAREEVDALQQLDLKPPVVVLQDLQTSQSIEKLANRLRVRPADILILYFHGHGVSDGGKAWLLCSDYLPREQTGRYALHDFLGQIQQCPADLKLLLLDAGSLACDPRIGMVVNEFPRLLEQEVRAAGDSRLWVLSSCRPMDVSHVCGAARRSAFNYFVTEGLWGRAADRNRGRWVELDELFAFVRNGVSDWVHQECGAAESQTPWLLHGGVGADEAPPQMRLVPVLTRPEAKEAKEQAAPQGQAATSASNDVKRVRSLLDEAWTFRDEFGDRKQSWSPADYAPHLWREYQELLLGYERQYRAGEAFAAAKLAENLEKDVLSLKKLLHNETTATTPEATVRRLADAQRHFRQQADAQQLGAWTRQNPALWEAIGVKNDAWIRAAYYVRWHAAAMRRSPRQTQRLYPQLTDLIEQLRKLADGLDPVEAAQASQTPAAQMQQIAGAAGRTKELLQAMDKEGLEKDAKELVETAELHPGRPGLTGEIEVLLETPLLPARLRMSLLTACDKLKQPPLEPSEITEPWPGAALSLWQDRLQEQAKLERQLVLLADPTQTLGLPDTVKIADGPAAEKQFWETFRGFGRQLGDFYQGLPQALQGELDANRPAMIRRCDRLLRSVDGRDAANPAIPDDTTKITLPPMDVASQRHSRLAVRVEKSVPLDAEDLGRLDLAIDKEGIPEGRGRIKFHYDPGQLVVMTVEGRQKIEPDQWVAVELNEDRTPLSYLLRAVAQNGKDAVVEVTAHCGEKTASGAVTVALPLPDMVELLVSQVVGNPDGTLAVRQETVQPQPDRLAAYRLRPFPNRTTSYRFDLVNRSGRKKSLVAQLFPLPAGFLDQTMARQAAAAVLENSRSPLGEAAVELPATAEPQRIRFAEPKGAAGEKPAPKPAGPEPAVPRPEVTHGVALVLRDAKTKEPKWIQPLEFSPVRPRDYLAPRLGYDAAKKTLQVIAQLAAGRDQPPLSEENPIRLTMEVRDSRDDATKKASAEFHGQDTALLYPGHLADKLFAEEIEPGTNKRVRVELAVDGYPRAFVYEVACDATRDAVRSERDLRRVQIMEPVDGSAMRPLERLPVKLRIDAPEDAFLVTNVSESAGMKSGDMVRVEIFDERDPASGREKRKDLFDDRQTEIRLAELGPEGEVKVAAAVRDFAFQIDSHGLKNVKARLRAQLKLAQRDVDEHSILVVLDGQPPQFSLETPSRPVRQGDDINVAVKVLRELSGIKKIEIGLEGDKPGEFKDKPKAGQPMGEQTWTVTLPSKDIDPGRYTILARATDLADNAKDERDSVVIVASPPPPAEKPAAKVSTIEGQVVLQGGGPVADIQVTLQGTGQTATTDAGGKFVFNDVPHGQYSLTAKGTAKNYIVSGKAQVTLPGPVEPTQVLISVAW